MELTNQHLPFELTKEYLEKIQAAISEQNNEFIRTEMEELFPADITNILYELEGEEAHYLVTLLDTKLAAEIIINLDPDDRKKFLKNFTSQQIAEYVALGMLGYPVSFNYGDVIIQELVCLDDPSPRSACKVLEPGDVIVAVDGKSTPTLTELIDAMADKRPDQDITVTVIPHKGGNQESRRVTLIASPDDPSRTIIGFIPADTRTVELPFEVEIDTDSIGGPSAGLAFTLALLDEMTPGDLFGGKRVVATGTVNEDGSVGSIGALPQKAVAVKMSDAEIFFVPASQDEAELALVRQVLGKSVRVIAVASVDDALTVLEEMGGSGLENATIDL